jgi:hypothetical protein
MCQLLDSLNYQRMRVDRERYVLTASSSGGNWKLRVRGERSEVLSW